jgi:hypothetical protein
MKSNIIPKTSYRYLSDDEVTAICFKIMNILKDMHIGQAIHVLEETKALIKDLSTVDLDHPLFREAVGALEKRDLSFAESCERLHR